MLRLVKTCECCPEQYDVYATNKMVGYIRCRWGEAEVYGSPENGEFKDWELIYLSLLISFSARGFWFIKYLIYRVFLLPDYP